MKKATAFLTFLVACAAFAVTGGNAGGTACPSTIANRLTGLGNATQLVTVVSQRQASTTGAFKAWEKRGECWRPVAGAWTAWLGQRGVSEQKREGDRTTPSGIFGFQRTMYGIASNPGVRYRYHRVVCGDWWVEDSRSPYYNKFRHVRCGSQPPFRITSEDMSRSPTAYRHLAVIDYNTRPVVPGKGSGIFLHVTHGNPTLGCVALPLPRLLWALRWLDPAKAPLIAIGTRARITDL
jgi:L,D-peptidoglycan transpeptidase YkuD (ErfK/YbiS/YcfS/YnhG family)